MAEFDDYLNNLNNHNRMQGYEELQNFYFIHQALIQNFKGVDNQFKMWLNKDNFNADAVRGLLSQLQNYTDALYELQGIMDNLGSSQYAKEWQDKIDLCYANCANKMLLPQVNTYLKQIQDLVENNNETIKNSNKNTKTVNYWQNEYDMCKEVEHKDNNGLIISKGFIVSKKGFYGVVDIDGKIIVPCSYEICSPIKYGFIVSKNNKYGFINNYGGMVLCEYDYMNEIYSHTYKDYVAIEVMKNNKFGLIDYGGKILTLCKYDKITPDYNTGGSFVVEINSKKGWLDFDGNLRIPCGYDYIEFNQGYLYFIVRNNNREGIIDSQGNVILHCQYDIGSCFRNSNWEYSARQNGKYLPFDSMGNLTSQF